MPNLLQKKLRKNQTDAERRLWYHLRNCQLNSYKFRRQHKIDKYIVDFICIKKKLIIELDGGQHVQRKVYDKKRTANLEADGYTVIRFWNDEIFINIEEVLMVILQTLIKNDSIAA